MEPFKYKYQYEPQTPALEDAGVVSRKLSEFVVRYIMQQLEPMFNDYFKRRAKEQPPLSRQ